VSPVAELARLAAIPGGWPAYPDGCLAHTWAVPLLSPAASSRPSDEKPMDMMMPPAGGLGNAPTSGARAQLNKQ